MKRLALFSVLLLSTTSVQAHNNTGTPTNVDVFNWVRTAPKLVKQNFRITYVNEATFESAFPGQSIVQDLSPTLPLPPPCATCPDPPDPLGVYQWIQSAPTTIQQNFQISIIQRSIFSDDPDGGTPEPPPTDAGIPGGAPIPPPPPTTFQSFVANEITIERIWVTGFGE
jgi:hypothetical protein